MAGQYAVDDSGGQYTPYQVPIHMQGSNMLQLTNPSTDLYRMELMFKGYNIDGEGNEVRIGMPLMNEDGINWVCGYMRSIVNQIEIMGNIEEKDLRGHLMYYAYGLIEVLMLSKKKFNMDRRARRIITSSCIMMASSTLRRSLKEGDRRFWSKIVQEYKTEVSNKGQKQGVFGKLMGWNK